MIPKNNQFSPIFLMVVFSMNAGMVSGQQEVIRLDGITDAGFDRSGNLYLSTDRGAIIKYDSDYRKTLTYSPSSVIPLTSVDLSGDFRIFGFYGNDQGGLLLDRNFNVLNEISFTPFAGNVTAAAYGADHTIWLFDAQEISLKRINPILKETLLDIRLPLLLETGAFAVRQIKEYQNRIYVNNFGENIYVFDLLGNLLQKFEISTGYPFKFYNDKLFFIDGDLIKSIHLYTRDIQTVYQINRAGPIITVLPLRQGILLIFPNHVVRIG